MKRKLMIIVFLLGLLMVIVYYLTRPLDLAFCKETIINHNNKQYVFIARQWGVAGNHDQIELITPTRDTCVFYTDRLLYKNTSKGIIIIPPSNGVFVYDIIDNVCKKDTSIIIKSINDPDSTKYLYDNYKTMGYEKIETSVK